MQDKSSAKHRLWCFRFDVRFQLDFRCHRSFELDGYRGGLDCHSLLDPHYTQEAI